MIKNSFRKYGELFFIWLVMAFFAVLNGTFREMILARYLDSYPAHIISTFVLLAMIGTVSYLYFRKTTRGFETRELVITGLLWSMMTVGFEFIVAFVENTPIRELIRQYNFLSGQVWILVPIALMVSPWFFGKYLD